MTNRETQKFKKAFRRTDLYKQYVEQMPDKAIFKMEGETFHISVIQACWEMFAHRVFINSSPKSIRLRHLKNLNKWTVNQIAELTGSAPNTVCVWLTKDTQRPIPEKKLQMLEDEHNKINRRSNG